MNSFNPDDSELDDAINKAKSPQSSSMGDGSDSPPSNESLWVSPTIEISSWIAVLALPPHALAFYLGGEYVVVRHGQWSPPPPQHDNPEEERRLYHLWLRIRRWVGLSDVQLKAKYRRRDIADCSAEFVARLGERQEPSYTPPSCDDIKRWMPRCPDRLDATQQPALQARIVTAKINRDISEFFRPTDQLGAGNDQKRALEDFERQFYADAELFKVLNSPVPRVLSPSELARKMENGGSGSSGQNIGGRGLPN